MNSSPTFQTITGKRQHAFVGREEDADHWAGTDLGENKNNTKP